MINFFFLILLRLYQFLVAPLLGTCCRFYPSCSEYALGCVEKHGVMKGLWLTLKRLAKCHPYHRGGVDLVPEKKHQPLSTKE